MIASKPWLLLFSLTVSLSAQDATVSVSALQEVLKGRDPANVAELRALQDHVQSVIERCLPAVVSFGGATGVVTEDGFVLTAGHVTRRAGRKMNGVLHDGRRIECESLGLSNRTDTGLCKLLSDGDFPTLKMGRSGALARGEWVIMLGHPSGAKAGRSAPARLGRVLDVPSSGGYMVTDCTMQGGDSGGPLVDMQGRVVGINSRINRNLAQNMHVQIDAFHSEWADLLAGKVTEAPQRGRRASSFGLRWDSGADGARVREIRDGSMADAAGLKVGDVVVKIGDREVGRRTDAARALRAMRSKAKFTMVVERGDERLELQVKREEG